MIMRTLRLLTALSLLAMGAVHLQQYIGDGYSSIPKIGVLFLLNAIGAAALALGLILPTAAVAHGAAKLATGVVAAAGAAMALASLVALFVSENGTLFGFHETRSGGPVTVAIVSEVVAVVAGAVLAALCFRSDRSRESRPTSKWGSRSSISQT